MKRSEGMSALLDADVVLPAELSTEDRSQRQIKEDLERFEHLFGTDEDAFEQPTTSRKELWSYYLYYNGTRELFFTRIKPIKGLTIE